MRIPPDCCCSRRVLRSAAGQWSGTLLTPPAHSSRHRHQHHRISTTVSFPTPTTRTVSQGSFRALGRTSDDDDLGEERTQVVAILGATGTGKSKLSIDIGTRFPSEVINSDKIQLFNGLDITTNKMSLPDRAGVPHHLLGERDPALGDLDPAGFRSLASKRIDSIRARRRLPIVAGGSNSYVHALLADRYDPSHDPFGAAEAAERYGGLRYRCCLLWLDIGWGVLEEYLDRRVEEMVGMGMVEELAAHYDQGRAVAGVYRGLEMAIGVPEFDWFFLRYPPRRGGVMRTGEREAYEAAVEEIKANTRTLARRQAEKIGTMREGLGWEMRRLDATEAVRRKMEGRGRAEIEEAWERDVVRPSVAEVRRLVGGAGGGRRRWWGESEIAAVVGGRVRWV